MKMKLMDSIRWYMNLLNGFQNAFRVCLLGMAILLLANIWYFPRGEYGSYSSGNRDYHFINILACLYAMWMLAQIFGSKALNGCESTHEFVLTRAVKRSHIYFAAITLYFISLLAPLILGLGESVLFEKDQAVYFLSDDIKAKEFAERSQKIYGNIVEKKFEKGGNQYVSIRVPNSGIVNGVTEILCTLFIVNILQITFFTLGYFRVTGRQWLSFLIMLLPIIAFFFPITLFQKWTFWFNLQESYVQSIVLIGLMCFISQLISYRVFKKMELA